MRRCEWPSTIAHPTLRYRYAHPPLRPEIPQAGAIDEGRMIDEFGLRLSVGDRTAFPRRTRQTPEHGRTSRTEVVFALVLTVFSLPSFDPAVRPGLDSSWRLGLSLAYRQDLPFGDRFAFTYGPLGFLVNPQRDLETGVILGPVYAALCGFALYLFAFRAARRWLGVPGALALIAWFSFTAAAIGAAELAGIAFFLFGIDALSRGDVSFGQQRWLPLALGGGSAPSTSRQSSVSARSLSASP